MHSVEPCSTRTALSAIMVLLPLDQFASTSEPNRMGHREIGRAIEDRDPTSGLRLALFTGAYDHIRDGVSLTLNRLVRYLEGRGAAVRVFAPTVAEPVLTHAGTLIAIPSISAPGRPDYRLSLGISPRVRRELESFRPNLVHIATPDIAGRSALRWARRRAIPVVSSYHTHFVSYLDYYRAGRLEGAVWRYLRWFYAQCAHVYVPSESMEGVLRIHGIANGVRLWPRGVDVERFNPGLRSREWRAGVGGAPGDPIVTFVSRVVMEKGIEVFAGVVEELRRRGVPHRSAVVGDGPERAALEQRLGAGADATGESPGDTGARGDGGGAGSGTHFSGTLQDMELATAYASSDVFLFPSETETFGNVVLEAMASGLPSVCANATGSSSLVRTDETGFLAEPRNVEEFTARVELLCRDSAMRARMGRSARLAAESFDWDLVLERIAGYYGELVDLRVPSA